jgi:hypothetical protein
VTSRLVHLLEFTLQCVCRGGPAPSHTRKRELQQQLAFAVVRCGGEQEETEATEVETTLRSLCCLLFGIEFVRLRPPAVLVSAQSVLRVFRPILQFAKREASRSPSDWRQLSLAQFLGHFRLDRRCVRYRRSYYDCRQFFVTAGKDGQRREPTHLCQRPDWLKKGASCLCARMTSCDFVRSIGDLFVRFARIVRFVRGGKGANQMTRFE